MSNITQLAVQRKKHPLLMLFDNVNEQNDSSIIKMRYPRQHLSIAKLSSSDAGMELKNKLSGNFHEAVTLRNNKIRLEASPYGDSIVLIGDGYESSSPLNDFQLAVETDSGIHFIHDYEEHSDSLNNINDGMLSHHYKRA